MRVLLLWQYYPPETVGFALANRGMAFAKYLRAEGHDVVVFAPFHPGVRSARGESGEPVHRVATYESLREWLPAFAAVCLFPAILFALSLKARPFRPDLVVASQPSYTLLIQGLLLARLSGAKFIADIQDVYLQDEMFARGSPWRRPKLLLERFVTTHADFAFVVLPKMRDELVRHHGMRTERTLILHNGIDSGRFPSPRASTRKTIDLLHLGSPRAYYDTLRLVNAFSMLCRLRPGTRLVFTDCREDPYTASVRARVEDLGLRANVEFLGQLSRDEIIALMAAARLGVYTLYPEESSKVIVGTKVFEYFAMGLPVAHLGHPGGSLEEILSETEAGVVAYTPEAFSDQLSCVLDDPVRLELLSAAARRAASVYDWRVTVPRAFEACRSALGIRAPRSSLQAGGGPS